MPQPNISLLAKQHILIGVTGHRDLLPGDFEFQTNCGAVLNLAVRQVLQDIIRIHTRERVALLTCLAEGADLLVAFEADQLGIKIVPIVPETMHSSLAWENARKIFQGEGDTVSKNDAAAIKEGNFIESATILAANSNYLIALWDGVDTGLPGGTSDIIQMVQEQKLTNGASIVLNQNANKIYSKFDIEQHRSMAHDPKGKIIQVLTPRQKNKFPLANLQVPLAEFKGAATTYEIETGIFPCTPYDGAWFQQIWKWIKDRSWRNDIFLKFTIPVLLVLGTLVFGTSGFKNNRSFKNWQSDSTAAGMKAANDTVRKYHPSLNALQVKEAVIKQYNWDYPTVVSGNDFFKAVNLITFNSSEIDSEKLHWTLFLARILGLLVVITGFTIAFMIALGANFRAVLSLAISSKSKYNLIVGFNLMAFNLAADLKHKKKKVVMLDSDPDPNLKAEALRRGLYVYTGNPQSKTILKRLKAYNAENVFILTDTDGDNIRTVQELDQLSSWKGNPAFQRNWYIHIKEKRLNDLLSDTKRLSKNTALHIINIFESISRKLLLRFPVYRFDKKKSEQASEVFVFGNSEMAKQLVLTCLKQGQFAENNKLKITWFLKDKDNLITPFYRKYPCLWHDENNQFYNKPFIKEIRNYLFPEDMITFKELPVSDCAYFNEGRIQAAIDKKNIVCIYFCLEDLTESAAYLNALVPKIQTLQKTASGTANDTDIQLFCFYNLQDKEEVKHVEHTINKNIPHTPVIFFGNFLDECTYHTITKKALDILPMLVNLWYCGTFSMQQWDDTTMWGVILAKAKSEWEELSESLKESSRQAADHIWYKIRILNNRPIKIAEDGNTNKSFLNPDPNYSQVIKCAEFEHYRWCAERLLDGFLPLQDIDEESIREQAAFVARWNDKNNKQFKKHYQSQKLHIDLLRFDKLFTGEHNGEHFNEKQKDISLIEGIPFFMALLNNQPNDFGR